MVCSSATAASCGKVPRTEADVTLSGQHFLVTEAFGVDTNGAIHWVLVGLVPEPHFRAMEAFSTDSDMYRARNTRAQETPRAPAIPYSGTATTAVVSSSSGRPAVIEASFRSSTSLRFPPRRLRGAATSRQSRRRPVVLPTKFKVA